MEFEGAEYRKCLFSDKFFYVFCIAALILSIGLRFAIQNEPVGFDEGVYSYIAEKINTAGQKPYLDIFDHKPPIVYYLLAGAFRIFSSSPFTLHSTAIVLDILTILAVFLFASKFLGLKKGIISAAIYGSSFLLINRSLEPDVIMSLLLIISAFFYIKWNSDRKYIFLIASGIFLAFSIYAKQTAALFGISVLLYEFYLAYKKESSIRQASVNVLIFSASAFLAALPLLLYFIKIYGSAFLKDVIIFNLNYSADNPIIERIPKLWLLLLNMLWLSVVLAIFSARHIDSRHKAFFIFWIAVPLLFFHTTGEFGEHYFNQIAAPLIFLGVMSFDSSDTKARDLLKSLVFVGILALLFSAAAAIYDERRANALGGQLEVSSYIANNTNATDIIFSDEAAYAWLSGRENRYKVIYAAPSTAHAFDFSDFPGYANSAKYLILTHRQNFLPQNFINCMKKNWALEKKLENIGESFIEIWRNNGTKC